MRQVLQVVSLIALLICLSGCDAPPAAKDLVKIKHIELYVFVQRINDPDITKRPTNAQMVDIITAMAKDTESLDILLNNWKPDSGMSQVDLNGKTSDVQKMVDEMNVASSRPKGTHGH